VNSNVYDVSREKKQTITVLYMSLILRMTSLLEANVLYLSSRLV